MTRHVIALSDQAKQGGALAAAAVDLGEQALLAPEVRAPLGEEGAAALANLAAACRATLVDGGSVQLEADAFNAAMARAGLGYYIDTDLFHYRSGGTSPLLYTHRVERVRVFDVPGGQPERVVWLRRLDSVNIAAAALGSNHEGATAAIVLLDRIDHALAEFVLPGLAEGADFWL